MASVEPHVELPDPKPTSHGIYPTSAAQRADGVEVKAAEMRASQGCRTPVCPCALLWSRRAWPMEERT